MRILIKAKIKTSLSNPHSPIIRDQLSQKLPHIPVLFVRESCIVSLNEVVVCCKILCNHLWLGTSGFCLVFLPIKLLSFHGSKERFNNRIVIRNRTYGLEKERTNPNDLTYSFKVFEQ